MWNTCTVEVNFSESEVNLFLFSYFLINELSDNLTA